MLQLVTSTVDLSQSVPATLTQIAWLWETNEQERVTARQYAGTAVISEGHKEVVNIRTAGAASKYSAANAIRIRPNSLKPRFSTPLIIITINFPLIAQLRSSPATSCSCSTWFFAFSFLATLGERLTGASSDLSETLYWQCDNDNRN